MKKLLALVLCGIIACTGFSQMPGQRGGQQINGRFYGKVVDGANKGVEAASVTLVTTKMDSVTKKPREVIVTGMLTTPSGDFSLENVPVMGRYKLRVTGIGYVPYEQDVAFQMPNRNGSNDPSAMLSMLDKDLGNIKIEVDAQVLGGVTVTASKPLFSMGIDRKIFNVDKNLVSAGGTAVDIMKNVPSLNVDIDGNVTLRNNAPQIFVDGRPTNLTLEQIPADAIESVEIITNPSAKFDASGGTSGILNIVLKKNKRIGYSGNVRFNVDSRGRVGGGGDINVRQNKINVFANAMVMQRRSIGEGWTERTNFYGNPFFSRQDDESVMDGLMAFGRIGFDYFIDNRNTITVAQGFGRFGMDPENTSRILTDLGNNGSIDSLLERFNNSENQHRRSNSQVSFKHNFPKAGREWTADVTFNRGRNQNNNNIRSDYYVMPGRIYDESIGQEQLGSGKNNNLILQTDYTNPISDKSKFELGARVAVNTVNSATDYFNIAQNGTKTPITEQNVIFESQDRIYAAYATFSNRIKNFGYQLGLRAESSNYTGDLVSKNQSFNIEFPISLFPSVFLSQKINDNNDMQLNYSRRINRPGFWQLFPFTDISDIFNVSRGNPELKPEFTNSLELSYNKLFKNRDNILASIYFKNTNGLITGFQQAEYVPAYDSIMQVSSYVNANNAYVTGFELIGRNKVTKFWDLVTNANLFTSKIDVDLPGQPQQDQFLSYFFKINNTFRLPKNISIQLSADYQSKTISAPGGRGGGGRGGFGGGMFGGGGSAAQGFIRPNFGVDAGIRFEFLKERRASISLNVNDIFRTRKFASFTQTSFFVQDSERRRDPQVARLNFNWRFGKFDASLFKRKSTRAETGGEDMAPNM